MNVHLDDYLVRLKLDEARAWAEQQALVRRLSPIRRPARVVLGRALIRAGHWLADPELRRRHARRVTA